MAKASEKDKDPWKVELKVKNPKVTTYNLIHKVVSKGARIEIDSTGSDDTDLQFEVAISYGTQVAVVSADDLEDAVQEAIDEIDWPVWK